MLVLYVGLLLLDGCFGMHCRVSNPFTVGYTVINKVGASWMAMVAGIRCTGVAII